jgi:SNF family Na+-dependent transporter
MSEKPTKSFDLPYVGGDNNGEATSVSSENQEIYVDDRPNWGSPVEFILSCMNFALGLGNVWRYPYLAYRFLNFTLYLHMKQNLNSRNGGGAFLIPYFLAACIIGLPIFFGELVVGQYSGLGPIKVS